ncbi:MAG: Fic/DOC family protein [Pseudoramibacter sp.]
MDKVYCYPGTSVLINKFNIRDKNKLFEVERRLSLARALLLKKQPIQGNFDLRHLQAIHKYLFSDIYKWAGEIRTVDIGKGSVFCHAAYIEDQARQLFNTLRDEHYLENISDIETISKKLAYYLSEINAIHPFREGNGRTQRAFIELLAAHNGFELSFSAASKEEMLTASKASFLCDYQLMEKLIKKCISKTAKI